MPTQEQQTEIKKGDRVNIYDDPITKRTFIKTARVTFVEKKEDYTDRDGLPMYRVNAVLQGERHRSAWWVSEKTEKRAQVS